MSAGWIAWDDIKQAAAEKTYRGGAPRQPAPRTVRVSPGQSRTLGAAQPRGSTATVLIAVGARHGRTA